MENATKALLIAGSVLIAILLITMGIKIFSSTKGTVDSAQTVMESTSTAIIMNQFSPYIGENIPTSKVIEFLNKAAAYNATVSDDKKIYIHCWFGNSFNKYGTDSSIIYECASGIKGITSSWNIVCQTGKTGNHDYKGYYQAFEIYKNS